MRRAAICFCFLFLINLIPLICYASQPCTRDEAIRAEKGLSSLGTWRDIHGSFKVFAQCDDGAIGEGYSNVVARSLSDDWSSLDQLSRLVAHDKSFGIFVLHHVDELMSPTQARKILDNAEHRCPPHAGQLCKAIIARLRDTSP
jgi:hypothetical protein